MIRTGYTFIAILLIYTSLLYAKPVFLDSSINKPDEFIRDNGINTELHKRNTGKITFMPRNIPAEEYKESDFLKTFELPKDPDLHIRVFLNSSLTNQLHKLAPGLSADDLNNNGNYSFSFFIDDKLIYTENLNPGAGSSDNKKVMTMLRVPLISSVSEDSWGRYLWQRFMFSGGEDALSEGTHNMKIEIRPYINDNGIITGEMIASGEIQILVKLPEISTEQSEIQAIVPGSGWDISNETYDNGLIRDLNEKILQNSFKEITSIVVIKNGKLLLEEYFNKYSRDSLHDTRSVGKSFASALTGISIADGFIEDENRTLGDFYDLDNFKYYSDKKAKVTLKSLLTMSSGFLGNDFDDSSPGNEENMYPSDNWVKFALDLPMDNTKTTGKKWDYFTAGVVVLGDILNRTVPGGLVKYSDKKLFKPLGIINYTWEFTPQGVANTAGGLRLRSLDYAKFGQLYKNDGMWNGKQVLTKEWVRKSLTKQITINESGKEYYGFLFWNMTFNVNNKNYEAFYSSGNGGNKIFIFKDEPLVVVITSTAYNKPYGHRQVNKMMERYILPAILK